MRISDWSSDVCSSDLAGQPATALALQQLRRIDQLDAALGAEAGQRVLQIARVDAIGQRLVLCVGRDRIHQRAAHQQDRVENGDLQLVLPHAVSPVVSVERRLTRPFDTTTSMPIRRDRGNLSLPRSEEHTSELQSLMRISY